MADPSFRTTLLKEWLQRLQTGDLAARDELLRSAGARLERLARKMLRGYPRVRRWADTNDVLQNAELRLLRALQDVRPASTREFFGLASEQIRRELLDLARHFYGPHGQGANHASSAAHDDPQSPMNEPPDSRDDPEELERWRRFHEAVERLPPEEREVVGLIFYHDWTQAEVAELFQVSVRTVQRRWDSALVKLHGQLHDEMPER